jgi:phenylalanyl-tRNA synthetase alpha chain
MSSVEEVAAAEAEEREALAGVADERALEEWRTRVLGRSGRLTAILRSLGSAPPELRRELGQAANRTKAALEAALEERRGELAARALAAAVEGGALDVTLPGRPRPRGGLHPITQTLREILDVFARMGFASIEGPEVELDVYNFDRLRIPEDHPARDMWDTFWFDEEATAAGRLLLRTHTSPMQIRFMEQHEPPIRIVVPGRCYRYEATDATHEWMMQQVEVLAIDEGVSMADLKGTLTAFAREIFGPERQLLLRNSYFPFVEPGVELAVDCFVCDGTDPSCAVCRGSRWLEIMGAGMVHPEIIEAAGYDSTRYTGFAAGMGVERIAMLRHGVEDIRHFYANDLRFLQQF